MGKHRPYLELVDSNVPWLGKVPSHWRVHQLKRAVEGCVNGVWGSEPDGINDIAVIRVADFDRIGARVNVDDYTMRSITLNERRGRLLKSGDLLIEKSGGGDKQLVGAVVIHEKPLPAVTSNFVARMSPAPGYNPIFLKYVFHYLYSGRVNYPSIKQATGIQNLDSNQYLSEYFSFPPTEEQNGIASFLDHETTKIDRLIAKQERLIELLKEKRQAVISHAVTKGLNPDAPMKNSGVEWLGEVPAHWSVSRIKHAKSMRKNAFVDGPFGSNLKGEHFIDDGDVYVIESNFATQGILREGALKTISFDHFLTINRSETKGGDIIIAKIGAQFGKASILPSLSKQAVVSGNSLKLTVAKGIINNEYLCFVLGYLKERGAMDLIVNATAQPALSLGDMNNLEIPLPSLDEQKEILADIHKKLNKIDETIAAATRAIELMTEHRVALISATVTGKIDVRGWCKPDMELEKSNKTATA
ncbi:restriction endonuclease subunit S [Thiohalobacter thiocyanaticus]|uniref:Restriction endonuclease subunit S n=1 Tax=Thiohalobacter thiocyanaticus TaxID=585455 RepID=A0A426QJN0_9GAMM|nr:restriction endonuclease subunit S [Thiohalobacter thiocyanaticus]RRQ21969.1 restriction endonuclease subunit S [Thiohalobacter thiocyanaticus]